MLEVFAIVVKQYRAQGRSDSVIVPTLIGRTAAATEKAGSRSSRTYEELLAATSDDTRELLDRVHQLAQRRELVITEGSTSSLLKTAAQESLATVYLQWEALDVAIKPLREAGWDSEADRFLVDLRAITTKQLSAKYPSIPAADVIAHWDTVSTVLTSMAELYRMNQ